MHQDLSKATPLSRCLVNYMFAEHFSLDDYFHHLQILLHLLCFYASNKRPSPVWAPHRDFEAKRYKHQAAEITEAHKQVNTEHFVLLPQGIIYCFLSWLSLSLHTYTSTHCCYVTCYVIDNWRGGYLRGSFSLVKRVSAEDHFWKVSLAPHISSFEVYLHCKCTQIV